MTKRLEESEATSTRAAKKLSEKQKIIQEQGNLIKDLAAQEKLKKKERAHDVMAKYSGDN